MTIVAALLVLLPCVFIVSILLFLGEFEKLKYLRKVAIFISIMGFIIFLVLTFYLWEAENKEIIIQH